MLSLKNIEIIYSNRRTLALQLNKEGKVFIRAPFKISKTYIENFIHKKQNWILKKQQDIANRNELYPKPNFTEGSQFYYLGNKYSLEFSDKQNAQIIFDKKFIIGKDWHNFAKLALVKWYKKQAKIYLEQRLLYHSQQLNLNYQKLRISNATSSWGSCSFNNIISLSWRLIMADAKIIDYVIIHELCHTKHKNHSKVFWQEVSNAMPEYKMYIAQLKKIGNSLIIDK